MIYAIEFLLLITLICYLFMGLLSRQWLACLKEVINFWIAIFGLILLICSPVIVLYILYISFQFFYELQK